MTESKFKRIVVASTVGAVLLLVILLSVLVYQLISIKKQNDLKNEYIVACKKYDDLIKQGEQDLDIWGSEWKIEERARELGYIYEDDYRLK